MNEVKSGKRGIRIQSQRSRSFEDSYVIPHRYNLRQSVRIRRFSMNVKYNNNKGNNDDIDPKGGGSEKTQESINITVQSGKKVGGSTTVTKIVRQEGETGLEVHSIHLAEPKNKRLKDSVDNNPGRDEETDRVAEVTLEVGEKRRIEQERGKEQIAFLDKELQRRSEERESARVQVERERVQKEAEVTRNVKVTDPGVLDANKTLNSDKLVRREMEEIEVEMGFEGDVDMDMTRNTALNSTQASGLPLAL